MSSNNLPILFYQDKKAIKAELSINAAEKSAKVSILVGGSKIYRVLDLKGYDIFMYANKFVCISNYVKYELFSFRHISDLNIFLYFVKAKTELIPYKIINNIFSMRVKEGNVFKQITSHINTKTVVKIINSGVNTILNFESELTGYSFSPVKRENMIEVTKDNFTARMQEASNSKTLNNLYIDDSALPYMMDSIYQQTLEKGINYQNVAAQWKSFSRDEWDVNYGLRTFVYKLENWLDNTGYSDDMIQLLFNVSMSYCFMRFGVLKFDEMFAWMLKSVVFSYINDKYSSGSFELCTGGSIPFAEIEEKAALTLTFIGVTLNQGSVGQSDSGEVFNILKYISLSTFLLIRQRNTSLSFTYDDSHGLFTSTCDPKLGAKLLLLLLHSGDYVSLRQRMTAVSLVLLREQLHEYAYRSDNDFSVLYTNFVKFIDPFFLFINAYNIPK